MHLYVIAQHEHSLRHVRLEKGGSCVVDLPHIRGLKGEVVANTPELGYNYCCCKLLRGPQDGATGKATKCGQHTGSKGSHKETCYQNKLE